MKATTGHSIEDKLFWYGGAMIRGKKAVAWRSFIDLSRPGGDHRSRPT